MDQVKCPACKGSGKEITFHNTGSDYRKHFSSQATCTVCNGSGKASSENAAKIEKRNQFWDKVLNNCSMKKLDDIHAITPRCFNYALFGYLLIDVLD